MKKLLTCLFFFTALFFFQNSLFAQYDEERLTITGFMDFAYIKNIYNSDKAQFGAVPYVNNNSQFIQNSLNMYFNFKVDDGWKAFTEIRFLYLPTGNIEQGGHLVDANNDGMPEVAVDGDTGQMTADGISLSYSNTAGNDPMITPVQYGSIYIERAYIEWDQLSFLKARFGRYFTPFGIWSNEHSSPAVTSIKFPFFVVPVAFGSFGMPLKQTGIEVLGNIPVSELVLQYAVYTGNGMSNAEASGDQLDDNKSIGGFLNIKLPAFFNVNIELGSSGYRGKKVILSQKWAISDGSTTATADVDGNNMIYITMLDEENNQIFAAKQWETNALAHMKATIYNLPLEGTFIIQSEYMRQWIDPDKDDRIQDPVLTGLEAKMGITDHRYNRMLQEKYTNDIYYIQAEYQFYSRLTPYFRYEHFETTTLMPLQLMEYNKLTSYVAGLNFKPVPKVSIKVEYSRNILDSPFILASGELDMSQDLYMAQIAVAF